MVDNKFETETLRPQEVIDLEKDSPVETSEQELNSFVEKGDFELVLGSPAFAKRSPQGRVILIRSAMKKRTDHLDLLMTDMLREGQEGRAAAMAIVQESKMLKEARDEIVKMVFEGRQRPIPEETW